MLEMRLAGPEEALLLEDGREVGRARWEIRSLSWGRERAQVARVRSMAVPAQQAGDFWAYLTFLWQRQGAAAALRDGVWFWFSDALRQSWEASGRPENWTP